MWKLFSGEQSQEVTDVYCSVEFSHCYLPSLPLTGCVWYWLLLTLCMEVLQHWEMMTGVKALFMQARPRWSGHLVCMPDTRFPKTSFYSQLASGSRLCGQPIKRYKGSLKRILQLYNIDTATTFSATDVCVWKVSARRGAAILRGHHFQQWQLMVRDRVRVRVSRLVVAISRTISCSDHERRLSEWRTFQNGGPEPCGIVIYLAVLVFFAGLHPHYDECFAGSWYR